MRSKLLAELLSKLDAGRSFSRPHTSNDNTFSESAFKTLKYHPMFPKEFHGDVDGRAFCKRYFDWYNDEHHHSGIALLTPAEVHFGRADEVLKRRHDVKRAAYRAHPERFVKGPPRIEELAINPPPDVVSATRSEPVLGLATSSTSHGERQPPPGGPLLAAIDIPFSSTTTFTNTGGLAHYIRMPILKFVGRFRLVTPHHRRRMPHRKPTQSRSGFPRGSRDRPHIQLTAQSSRTDRIAATLRPLR